MQKSRTKIAAAAVAGGLVATAIIAQTWTAGAAPGDTDSTYVPMTPCRLADTRPGATDHVGDADTFAEDETKVFAAHGTNGDCTLPVEAVGLQLNVTGVNASQLTFATIWPDGVRPKASSINPTLDQPPAPNAVATQLAADGSFSVYNRFGTLDLVIDVQGYFTGSSLVDLDTRVSAATASVDQLTTDLTALSADVDALEPRLNNPFVIRLDIGETEIFSENGTIALEAACVDLGGGSTDAVIRGISAADDSVVMEGDDDFSGNGGDFLLTTTLEDDREMFSNSSTGTDVDNDIDSGFLMNASGAYIGLDGETVALGVNYGVSDCFFVGTTTSFSAAG